MSLLHAMKKRNLKMGSGESMLEYRQFIEDVADEIATLKKTVAYTYPDKRQRDAEKRVESDLIFRAFFKSSIALSGSLGPKEMWPA